MAAKNWEESRLTDKEPLPMARAQEKLVIRVGNILLSHSDLYSQEDTDLS